MILYVITGLACGIIGFWIGLFYGAYTFLREHGMLPHQSYPMGNKKGGAETP